MIRGRRFNSTAAGGAGEHRFEGRYSARTQSGRWGVLALARDRSVGRGTTGDRYLDLADAGVKKASVRNRDFVGTRARSPGRF